MSSPLLSEAAISELTEAIVRGRLYEDAALRATFFRGQDAAGLPLLNAADAQARSDLHLLSTLRRPDASAPLDAWLEAVHSLLAGRDSVDAPLIQRHRSDVTARLRAENAAHAPTSGGTPRAVENDALILHVAADAAAANSLRTQLPRRRLRFEDRLITPRDTESWRFLESLVRRSRASMVWLSPAALAQMESDPARARRMLGLLDGISQVLIGVLPVPSDDTVRRARALWPFRVLAPPAAVAEPLGTPVPPRTVGVPFVIVSPTADEVAELLATDSPVSELGPAKRAELTAVRSAVQSAGGDLQRRYARRRDAWCPFDDGRTVRSLITARIEHLNRTTQGGRHLVAQVYPFDALAEGDTELQPLYDDLARSGCVILLDELCLFHPRLRRAFLAAPFQHAPNSAMVTVRPLDANRLPAVRPIHEAPLDALSHALYRFSENLDPQCQLSIGSPVRLDRWLHAALPGVVETMRTPRADPNRLARFMADEGAGQGMDLTRVIYFDTDP
jgi:hypothetical protein